MLIVIKRKLRLLTLRRSKINKSTNKREGYKQQLVLSDNSTLSVAGNVQTLRDSSYLGGPRLVRGAAFKVS